MKDRFGVDDASSASFSDAPLVVSPLVVARIADLAGSETVPGSLSELAGWVPSETAPAGWPADPVLLDLAARYAAAAEQVAAVRTENPAEVAEDPEALLLEAERLLEVYEFSHLSPVELSESGSVTEPEDWCGSERWSHQRRGVFTRERTMPGWAIVAMIVAAWLVTKLPIWVP